MSKKARVLVRLRPEVLDPQGEAVKGALHQLGFSGIRNVRVGKLIELEMASETTDEVLNAMCQKLLGNPVIEDAVIERISSSADR